MDTEITVTPGTLVVEGVLRGIEAYALRPAPATGYAARRIRARTFRAGILTQLLELRTQRTLNLAPLAPAGGSFTPAAGGRFLLAGAAQEDWQAQITALQREFDAWLFEHVRPAGTLRFTLAAALATEAKIPLPELARERADRGRQPFEGVLRNGTRWNSRAFVMPAGARIGLCAGCAAAVPVRRFGDESLCDDCAAEGEIGERLTGAAHAWMASENEAEMAGPGIGLRFSAGTHAADELALDSPQWALLRYFPSAATESGTRSIVTFEELASQGGGRRLLGCLRLRVDHAARAFAATGGEPSAFLSLAARLHTYFGEELQQQLQTMPLLYPVWSGGDEALLIGPWQQALEAATRLGPAPNLPVTLSAGLALAPPEMSVAAMAAQADDLCRHAEAAGGGRLNALGFVVEWPRAASLLDQGRAIGAWVERGIVEAAWVERLAALRRLGNNGSAHGLRPRLETALAVRIRHRQAREWASGLASGIGSSDSDWHWMEFLARYATLAAGPTVRGAAQPAE